MKAKGFSILFNDRQARPVDGNALANGQLRCKSRLGDDEVLIMFYEAIFRTQKQLIHEGLASAS